LVKADQWLVTVLQGLELHDVDLFDGLPTTTAIVNAQRTAPNSVSEHQILQFARFIYQSFLWILAAYEFVRTLDEICRADCTIYGDALSQDVNKFKHHIERLRIPLAKLKATRRHPNDYEIAYPGWVPEKGVAWQLDPSTIITRVDLSEELVSLLEKLKSNRAPVDLTNLTSRPMNSGVGRGIRHSLRLPSARRGIRLGSPPEYAGVSTSLIGKSFDNRAQSRR
jgi:hypothetical protein